MKVILEDFQILSGIHEFDFPNGITVMTGPNASGKSTVFYAIQNALKNTNGVADCINHGANKASVTIENNGNSVSWIRTKSSSVYRDNKANTEYVNASRLDSRDIADLGFYYNSNNEIVNIHDEWSVLFPFGESDTQMFRLFEDIFNISCSFQVIDEMKKDEQEIKSEINKAEMDLNSLKMRQTCLLNIINKLDVTEVENRINNLTESSQFLSELREDYLTLSQNIPMTKVVLPNVYDLNLLYDSNYKLRELKQDFDIYSELYNRRMSIPKFDNREFVFNVGLDELNSDYMSYVNNLNEIKNYNTTLADYQKRVLEINDSISKLNVCPTCGRLLED